MSKDLRETRGETGAKGDTGAQGPKGDKGDKGDQGKQGIQGERGAQGPQGIQGIQGDIGETGPTGESAFDTWKKTNPEGTFDDFLEVLRGEKGDQGPQGETGIRGEQGPKGDPGVNATTTALASPFNDGLMAKEQAIYLRSLDNTYSSAVVTLGPGMKHYSEPQTVTADRRGYVVTVAGAFSNINQLNAGFNQHLGTDRQGLSTS